MNNLKVFVKKQFGKTSFDSVFFFYTSKAFGTLYVGLNLDTDESKRTTGLFFPFFFVIRRLLFLVAAMFMQGFLWGQLAIQFFSCTTMVIYLMTFWPFEDPKFTEIELMNELTSILLLYHMFCFTDWIPDANVKYELGFSCLMINSVSLCVNIIQILYSTFFKLYRKARTAYFIRQHSKNRKK